MQFSLSGNLATMANGFPYSVGAQVAFPNRQVIAIVGDGGFTMLMGELATCVKYKLPVKVIIFKNNVLGQIKWEQMVFEGNPEFGVELQPIDFAKVAEGFGAAGFTIEDPKDASRVLEKALNHPGPGWSRPWSIRTSRRCRLRSRLSRPSTSPSRWHAVSQTGRRSP
jgi:thiamine pyrophosphate-dependent acetolactate synthase large subunit-like protein